MPLPSVIYDVLKEKLADVKVEYEGAADVLLLDLITDNEGWYEKAIAAKKIQENNKAMKDEKKALEAEKKELSEKVKTLVSEIDKTKENQLTEDERKEFLKLKKQGMTDDMTARFNAIEASNKELADRLASMNTELETERQKAISASINGARKELENKALTALSRHRIEGSRAAAALAILKQEGMIDVVRDENNGGYKEKIRIYKDGKELESSLEKMCETFAKENEYLVSGTSRGGTGDEHRNSSGGNASDMPTQQLLKHTNKGYDN